MAAGDRIADTAIRAVERITASLDGTIYVLHTDRTYEGNNSYGVARQTVYRLEPDEGDGGGNGNGNGGGGGKGKPK